MTRNEAGGPSLDFIASTATLDRYDEIILPSGWRLENYRKNPVFQNAHQYGDILFTLGRALTTEVREVAGRAALVQRIEFATDINPMARIAYGLYRGKFLNAVSVGFIPIRWENGAADAPFRRRYLEQELLEVSAVGIPANPEALQLGWQTGVIEKTDLREALEALRRWQDLRFQISKLKQGRNPGLRPGQSLGFQISNLKQPQGPDLKPEGDCKFQISNLKTEFRSQREDATADTGALGGGVNEAHWLQLARDIRRLMKRL